MDRALKRRLEARFADALVSPIRQRHDETELRIRAASLTSVIATLHDDPGFRFRFLIDLAGIDTGDAFQVAYHLWSETTHDWLRLLVVDLPRERPRLASIAFLWKGAEWMEREAYDMFGLVFEGNRDLRRIYMPVDYESFPLRKDFYLPDDASRAPGGGVIAMERTNAPSAAADSTLRRRSTDGSTNGSAGSGR